MKLEDFASEELKNETKQALSDAKDALKNLDVKEEMKATEKYLNTFIKNPIEGIRQSVALGDKNFTMAIVLNLIWIIVRGVRQLVNVIRFSHISFTTIFTEAVASTLGVIVLSATIYFVSKEKKKTIKDLLCIITIARLPIIIFAVIQLLTIISQDVTRILSPFSLMATALSLIFIFFAIKGIENENDDNTLTYFIKSYGLYLIVRFLMSFLNMTI